MNSPDPRVALQPSLAPTSAAPILESLDQVRPIVRIGQPASEAMALAAAALYSLLIRMHAHTCLEGDASLGANPWGVDRLSALPSHLSVCAPIPAASHTKDVVLAIGNVDAADLWIGGDDWTARLGRCSQASSGKGGLGILAATAFAAAETLKLALGPAMTGAAPLSSDLIWNLLNYRREPATGVGGQIRRLEQVVFFGSGSVGSSAIGIAGTQRGLKGSASVVDPDTFDPDRNPFRYPASTGLESGPKAAWTADLLRTAGWEAVAEDVDVATWARNQLEPGLTGVAISSVDTVEGRLQVADVLPQLTLSVGVHGLALHLQKERCFDDLACPFCDFAELPNPISQAGVHAQMTGLPVDRVIQLELGEDSLTDSDLAIVVAAGKLHPDRVQSVLGRRLPDLIQRLYAQALVDSGSGAVPMAVSAPFVSWMGGVLIVAELLKLAIGAGSIDRRIDLDLSGHPLGVVSRRPRDRRRDCICRSPHRQRWATRLYGNVQPAG
jgi:hypothetical protein